MISFARVIVLGYVPLFFCGAAIGNTVGQDALRGLPLVPAGLYVVARLGTALLTGRATRLSLPSNLGLRSLLLFYALLYGFLFFPRAFPGLIGMAAAPTILIHAAFWLLVPSDEAYAPRRDLFVQDLARGVALGFTVGFTLTLHAAGWSIRPGAIHNLSNTNLVRSDVDVPLLTMILTMMGAGVIHGANPNRSRGQAFRWRTVAVLGLSFMIVALAVFFLYSRRTPILATAAGLLVLHLPTALQRYTMYATVLLAVVAPFVWRFLALILLWLTQNPLVDAVMARNDPEDYLTATRRVLTWRESIQFIQDVRPAHLFGYGGLQVLGDRVAHAHAHNVFLQLFFDAGLLTLAIAVLLLVGTFRLLGKMLDRQETQRDAAVLLALLVAWLVLGAVEPGLRQFSLGHLMFLTIAAYAITTSDRPTARNRGPR